jgi:hypothetical protein
MAKTVHGVEYLYPGIFVSENECKDITSPDPALALKKMPKGAYAFRFYEYNQILDMKGKPKNFSGWTYPNGRVYTLAEIKKKFPQQKILISNMEGNGWNRVVETQTHNWVPFTDKDQVVITKEK